MASIRIRVAIRTKEEFLRIMELIDIRKAIIKEFSETSAKILQNLAIKTKAKSIIKELINLCLFSY